MLGVTAVGACQNENRATNPLLDGTAAESALPSTSSGTTAATATDLWPGRRPGVKRWHLEVSQSGPADFPADLGERPVGFDEDHGSAVSDGQQR